MNNDIKNINLSFKCPVDYAAMTDIKGGKFCNHCQKNVYDFTNSKADVFRQILAENNNSICGRFTIEQMAVQQTAFNPAWKKWLSAAMVLIGINLWEGKALAQQSKTSLKSAKGETIERDPLIVGEVSININDTTAIFGPVEVAPEVPGGAKQWGEFLKNNLKKVPGASGKKVFATFIIEKNGSLSSINILRGINKQADKEVVRVLKLSPKWKPGTQKGKPVRTQYSLPVTFK